MKTLLKLGAVVIFLLALTTCTFNQISVQWSISGWTTSPASTFTTITFDVWNAGKYDLKNIKLTFSVFSPSGYIYPVTPGFDLSQGDTLTTYFVVNVAPDTASLVTAVEIVGVDMDKPKDS